MANPLNTTKDSLTTDNQVVRLLTSPCGPYTFCFLKVAGRGFECAHAVFFLVGRSKVKVNECRTFRVSINSVLLGQYVVNI